MVINSVINESRVMHYFSHGRLAAVGGRRSASIDLCIQTAYSLIACTIRRGAKGY